VVAVEDEDRKPVGNRTIQIDALTDVELVDHHRPDAAADDDEAPIAGRAPPPLPRKAPRPPSLARNIGLTVIALATGVVFALGVVHFLFPSVPTTAATTAPPTGPEVRHLQLDEELVIRADEPAEAR
jgi:hypothetical protein